MSGRMGGTESSWMGRCVAENRERSEHPAGDDGSSENGRVIQREKEK